MIVKSTQSPVNIETYNLFLKTYVQDPSGGPIVLYLDSIVKTRIGKKVISALNSDSHSANRVTSQADSCPEQRIGPQATARSYCFDW